MPSLSPSAQHRRILLPSFRKYGHLVALTVVVSLLAALFEGFSVGLLVPFLDNLSDASSDAGFRTGLAWVDQHVLGVGAPKIERMYRICAVILATMWLRAIFGYFASFYGVKSRVLIVEDFRMRIVDQLQAVSLRFFSKTRAGEILNTLTNELSRVAQALGVVVTVVSRGTLLLVYVGLMLWISWKLSLLVLFFFGALVLAMTWLIQAIRQRGQDVTRANGHFTSSASEFIDGVRTVVAFNMQRFERDRLQGAANDLAEAVIESSRRSQLVQPISQLCFGTVLIGVLILAVQFYVLPGALDVAPLLVFLLALFRLVPIVHQLNGERGRWAEFSAALQNVADLLRRDDKPYLSDGDRPAPPLREAVTFEDVSFAYEPGEPVLKDISLRIERGKTTALVGASGAGKTTLVDLIPRLHDPTEGRVLMDGTDLRAFSLSTLREKIAVVSQSTFIFNDTVRANIAYGRPDAPMDVIADAAKQANALRFIKEMENGFDTMLGDRGVRLSGGQRQRIAIARALLRDPEILILDEATSALDSVSEKLVQESVERLMRGRTVIAIAHRLSTVENADHVVVLEEGEIVEQGTYDELLSRKGQLWEYHAIQFQLA